ncbi:transcription antitermination factor NusB [Candidatus Dojkabacteria bacterium]|jgi:N utilization substance protein B|nr:transcription antitermination factor NusB [Candidatus Dojkabacteria bacterium]
MKTGNDPRHLARVLVLQLMFSDDFDNLKRESFTPDTLSEINEIKKYDKVLFGQLLAGVKEKKEEIDKMIRAYAPQWPIDQIKKVDLEVLRIAIFESFIAKLTPPKVAIDEAIELAKSFGGNTSDKFVNGVLGSIYETKTKEENGTD